MPLLGRHKSAASPSSSPSPPLAGTSQAAAAANNHSRQQLCDSPLFGIRRQLPSALDHQAPTSNSPYSTAAAAAANSSGGGGHHQHQQANAAGNKQQNIFNAELMTTGCSIPQQITRQQIHYAFSIMDTNKDGQADVRDLSQMLSNLGIPIDEAILAHIMTNTVSKRGDHRISEAEFLDWISHFIQISDSKPLDQKARASPSPRTALRASRSSTAGSSLAAQPSEVPRARRGSGSGLALMRSLSSSSASAAAAAAAAASGSQTPPTSAKRQSSLASLDSEPLAHCRSAQASKGGGSKAAAAAGPAATAKLSQQASTDSLEARNDLKAAFCVFDLDGDGFITLDEVRAGLKLLGESWTPAELRRLFSRCSGGGGNNSSPADPAKQRISIDDFVQLLL